MRNGGRMNVNQLIQHLIDNFEPEQVVYIRQFEDPENCYNLLEMEMVNKTTVQTYTKDGEDIEINDCCVFGSDNY